MPAARWTEEAADLTDDPNAQLHYAGLAAVSRATGLAASTVLDSLLRAPIDNPLTPRGALCRPAGRVGGVMGATPMWSWEQVDEYHRRVVARRESRRTHNRADLPVFTEEKAAELGLASIEDLAKLIPAQREGEPDGRAENTVRRYARDYRSFPPEVGITPRTPPHQLGPQRSYYRVSDVLKWVADHESTQWGSGEAEAG